MQKNDEPTSIEGEVARCSHEDSNAETPVVPSIGVPTLGGMQFWGDVYYRAGWKIQQNVLSGHFRLLNPSSLRFASGPLQRCKLMMEAIVEQQKLPLDRGKAVILLHGIGRSSRSFSVMANALKEDGYTVIPFEYPSTRVSMEQSAEFLNSLIKSLTNVDSIDFVVHSMGGLVVRTYLKHCSPDTRIRHLVMLGTPNRGAEMADMLQYSRLYRIVYGPAGRQLVTNDESPISKLPTPDFPFGIIAGGKGTATGFNPLLPGDDDGTVTVESARLPGAADYLRVPRIHSFLMNDETVIAATLSFLKNERFSNSREPTPIP